MAAMSAQHALGFADERDVDKFVETLERFERGEIDAEAWRGFRLLNGVYGQRQDGFQMLRVKIPQGVLVPETLRVLARVTASYGEGRAHVTTRQNVQLYFLTLEQAEEAMRELAQAGLTTKEACGNSVRNVLANPLAGVDPDEPFDVTPYAEALTRHFLRGPRSSSLPRKFKIAFEGSPRGVTHAAINDLSFFAVRNPAGEPGFRVLVAGGTSTLARSGEVLSEFVPVAELLAVSEAVVRVFHRDGNRENRAKARIKWLVKKLGWAEVQARILAAWDEVRAEGGIPLPFDPALAPTESRPAAPVAEPEPVALAPGYADFRAKSVRVQKQPGWFSVFVTLLLGDLTPAQLEGLADLIVRFGDGTLRTTIDQNLVLRNVADAQIPALHAALVELGLSRVGAGSFADVTSCAGADTCSLAVTASRGMARDLAEHLAADDAALGADPALHSASIKVSGCPNGCGQNHVASISLQGGVRKIGGRPLPVYLLGIGGGAELDANGAVRGARFARLVGKLPARRGRQAVARLRALHAEQRLSGESFDAFLARLPTKTAQSTLADLFLVDETSATEQDFVDLGQTEPFVVLEDA